MCNPFQQISRRVSLCLCVVADNHLFIYLSICLYISMYLSDYVSIYLSTHHLFIYLSISLCGLSMSVSLSLSLPLAYFSLSLSIALPLCLSISVSFKVLGMWKFHPSTYITVYLLLYQPLAMWTKYLANPKRWWHISATCARWHISAMYVCYYSIWDDGIFQPLVLGGMFQPLMSATILYDETISDYMHVCYLFAKARL